MSFLLISSLISSLASIILCQYILLFQAADVLGSFNISIGYQACGVPRQQILSLLISAEENLQAFQVQRSVSQVRILLLYRLFTIIVHLALSSVLDSQLLKIGLFSLKKFSKFCFYRDFQADVPLEIVACCPDFRLNLEKMAFNTVRAMVAFRLHLETYLLCKFEQFIFLQPQRKS